MPVICRVISGLNPPLAENPHQILANILEMTPVVICGSVVGRFLRFKGVCTSQSDVANEECRE